MTYLITLIIPLTTHLKKSDLWQVAKKKSVNRDFNKQAVQVRACLLFCTSATTWSTLVFMSISFSFKLKTGECFEMGTAVLIDMNHIWAKNLM